MGPRGRTAALRTERRSRSPPHPVMPAAKTRLGRDSREAAREKRPIFIRIGKPWSFWQRHWPACRSGWLWYSCTRGNTDRFPTARKAAGRNEASRSAFGKHSPSNPGNTENACFMAAGHQLGLAIAAKAVQNMGGQICARNCPTGGLIIEITLRKEAGCNAEDPDCRGWQRHCIH